MPTQTSGALLQPGFTGFPSLTSTSSAIGSASTPVSGTTTGTGYTAGAAPDLASLTNLVNSLNQTAQTNANAARIPGNPALEQQSSNNIASNLAGQIPPDVMALLNQQGAERGIATGSPGSDNANSATMRALGLTSLGLQQQGQQNLSAADARNPGAPIFDPTTQLLTPYQAGTLNNQGNQLSLEWWKALNPNYGQPAGGGRGQQPTQPDPTSSTPTNPSSNWWSSLFPPAQTAPSPTAGNTYGSTTTSTPGGSSYTTANQDFTGLFGDPYSTANPAQSTSSGYDPYAASTGIVDPFGLYGSQGSAPSNSYDPYSSSTGISDPFGLYGSDPYANQGYLYDSSGNSFDPYTGA